MSPQWLSSALRWVCWCWQEPTVSESREEQNIVILFSGVMSKSVIFKIHFVSVSFWTRRSRTSYDEIHGDCYRQQRGWCDQITDDQGAQRAGAVPVFPYSLGRRESHLTEVCARLWTRTDFRLAELKDRQCEPMTACTIYTTFANVFWLRMYQMFVSWYMWYSGLWLKYKDCHS